MKIVHLTEYFQPKLGYQEYYLASIQQKLGHKVTVVTSDRYFPFPDFESIYKNIYQKRIVKTGQFIEEDVKVIRLPVLFEFGHGSAIYISNLFKTLNNISPDIIEVDGVFSILSWQAACYSQKFGVPLVYDTHASTFNTKLSDSLVKKIYYSLYKKLVIPQIKKNARAYLAVGESERYLLCREFRINSDEVQLIPLGADINLFKKDEKARAQIRKKLKVESDDVLVIYAGKISKEKDIHILIEAASLLIKSISKAKFILVGEGKRKYLTFLKRKIYNLGLKKHMIFNPFVAHNELYKYYSAADIGVWPGNPSNTILEALACNLPIIVPKVISLAQTSNYLVSYQNGCQFKRGESKDLTRCLEWLSDEKKRKAMGKKSRELVIDKFSWESIAQRHLEVYQHVLAEY